jgi:hypothetical protein
MKGKANSLSVRARSFIMKLREPEETDEHLQERIREMIAHDTLAKVPNMGKITVREITSWVGGAYEGEEHDRHVTERLTSIAVMMDKLAEEVRDLRAFCLRGKRRPAPAKL